MHQEGEDNIIQSWRRHIKKSGGELIGAARGDMPSNEEVAIILYPMARLAVEVPEFRRQLSDRELVACCDFVMAVHDIVGRDDGVCDMRAHRELLGQINALKERVGQIVARPSVSLFQRELDCARRRAGSCSNRKDRAPGT